MKQVTLLLTALFIFSKSLVAQDASCGYDFTYSNEPFVSIQSEENLVYNAPHQSLPRVFEIEFPVFSPRETPFTAVSFDGDGLYSLAYTERGKVISDQFIDFFPLEINQAHNMRGYYFREDTTQHTLLYKKTEGLVGERETIFELPNFKLEESDPNPVVIQIIFDEKTSSVSYHYGGGELDVSSKIHSALVMEDYKDTDSVDAYKSIYVAWDSSGDVATGFCFASYSEMMRKAFDDGEAVLENVPPIGTKFTFTPTVSSGIRRLATKNTSTLTVTLQNNMLHYSFSQKETVAKHIQILDYKGSIVLDKWGTPQTENTIPLPEYISNGVYFVLLETEHESYVKKVMYMEE